MTIKNPLYVILYLSVSGEKIFPLDWDVTEALELYDIPVVIVTSDGAKSNLCQPQQKQSVPFKTSNPFRREGQLHLFF